ncbi:hypothetical protein D8674_034038 [Pyrus ussuriensis x Pyrus communis]|uniref:Uncharacterized protein n=1 Tax=Pyrus ussuriensis x Pyrus communis TaxID=2448454 RepID=A0A5N5HRB0_9ROSA|nr:hypothetical protein D8674_034038 [Pyrus ussuriensis x Pyrus communis]
MKGRRRVKPASFTLRTPYLYTVQFISGTAVEFNPFVFAAFWVFRYVAWSSLLALSVTCVQFVRSVVLVYQVAFGFVQGVKVATNNLVEFFVLLREKKKRR